MPDPIISVEGISKRYRLRHQSAGYTTLRDSLTDWAKGLVGGRRAEAAAPGADEEFWALKDVSFEINRGEVVGIIGRNGAGKSTLLKVLSRITEPTSGRIRLRGRVASLLEVGTGFHPELSGRENIFLNGAILGMTKGEIKAKFDEIVAFSEVEKFLDTPVKHYSSGMYVRLAFAVAAHLDPEVLIVDEVLAVGDAQFQKKCLGKMKDVAGAGRTVLVVSHQMNTITGLCDRGIMLQRGSVLFDGSAPEAVLRYQSVGGSIRGSTLDADEVGRTIGNDYARLHRAWTSTLSGEPAGAFDLEEPIQVWMEYSVLKPGKLQTYPNFHFFDEKGDYLFVSAGMTKENEVALNRPGRWIASCTVPGGLLNTGSFSVGVAVTTMNPGLQVAFFERDALMFQVTEDIPANLDTKRMGYAGPMPGTLRPSFPWTVEMVESPEAVAR